MGNYTRLSMRERCNLATFLDMGLSITQISVRMGRHRSTLYRELLQNSSNGYYRPGLAHHKARARRPRKALKLHTNSSLYHYVYDRLKKGWSPEQIVGRMRLESQPFSICAETIYRYAYQHGHKKLWKYLFRERRSRRPWRKRQKARCRFGNIRLIEKRPGKIEQRKQVGHWEGDLIEFQGTKKMTVTTLVERKSLMLLLVKNGEKKSSHVMSGIQNAFDNNTHIPCRTVTFDQGTEFAYYPILEKSLGCKVYYCQPRSPWQRGSNENMNGRLRRHLPRTASIGKISQSELEILAESMNTTPRKCLGYRTPKEVFLKGYPRPCRAKM